MNAVITWRGGGRKVIENVDMADPRVKEQLDLLAALRTPGVTLTFEGVAAALAEDAGDLRGSRT
jgi:hypothetical protein